MVRVSSALIKKRKGIFQKILKGFQLVSEDDNITIITREQAEKCIELISSVKDDIIASFPIPTPFDVDKVWLKIPIVSPFYVSYSVITTND